MVTPRLVSNSKTLRSWNPMARNCFYQHEKTLKFFKIYSLNNCQIECRANKTRELCGCVSHFDPSISLKPSVVLFYQLNKISAVKVWLFFLKELNTLQFVVHLNGNVLYMQEVQVSKLQVGIVIIVLTSWLRP